jgi:hypothetical protein
MLSAFPEAAAAQVVGEETPMATRTAQIGDWLWFLAWALGSSAACLATAWTTGATFDEPVHLVRGLEAWRTGSHKWLLHLGAMPLPFDLYTLPLRIWEVCRGVPFDLGQDVPELLPWFRIGPLVFWWLLLIYARLIGRQLAGPWAGRLAIALLASEPLLLAHASLGGSDIAVTACSVALLYHFRMGRDASWQRRLAWPTFWYAAAVLAKASGLVFGLLCMFVIEWERLARAGKLRRPSVVGCRSWLRECWDQFRPLRRDLAVIFLAGMALVFVYCGCDWENEPSFIAWAESLPDGMSRQIMVWVAEHMCIFCNAGYGLVRQVTHNMRGHGAYLLGTSDTRYVWYYFPIALTIKLSVPLLLAPLLVAAMRWRALLNWATVTAAMLLVFSLNCHVQIGVRLVLPLCVLLAIGVAAGLVQAIHEVGAGWRGRLLTLTTATAVCWTALAASAVWPHWLCYTNELWGGTETGYLCLSDSNYDWGQGVPELARWQQQHADTPVQVLYFGSDPALERIPARILDKAAWGDVRTEDDVRKLVRGHYVSAATTLLYGSYDRPEIPGLRVTTNFLRAQKPVDRTTTFLIYDFRRDHQPLVE